jgi:hypothetical protein
VRSPPNPSDGAEAFRNAFAVCLLVAAVACIRPAIDMLQTLGDTDDAMRLVQARALADGRGWWDQFEPRIAPPEGLAVHWSRLVDAPIAAMLALFGAVFGQATGETITRALWPMLLFVPMGWALLKTTQQLAGSVATWIVAGAAPLSFMMFGQFEPGRLDHHNTQIVLMAGMMLAALNLERPRNAALMGAACAISLAIGFESLPVIVWAGGLIGVRFVLDERYARSALAFASALAALAAGAFVLQTSPSLWLRSGCDALQFNGVAGAVIAGLGFAAAARWSPNSPIWRGAGLTIAGALGVAVFFALHPSCLHGPYADIDPRIGPIWLDRVDEARNFAVVMQREPVVGVAMFLLPLATLGVCVFALIKGRRDPGFVALTALLGLTVLVALIQSRGVSMATAAALPLAGAALAQLPGLQTIRPMTAGLALGLLVSPTLTLSGLRLVTPASVKASDARASIDQGSCFQFDAFEAMKTLPQGVVLADLDAGSHILAHTAHSAVAAPYHRAGGAIYDAMTVFYEPPEAAAGIVARDQADYVALCKKGIFAGEAEPGMLGHALAHGTPPPWLTPLDSEKGAYWLFRVNRTDLARD